MRYQVGNSPFQPQHDAILQSGVQGIRFQGATGLGQHRYQEARQGRANREETLLQGR